MVGAVGFILASEVGLPTAGKAQSQVPRSWLFCALLLLSVLLSFLSSASFQQIITCISQSVYVLPALSFSSKIWFPSMFTSVCTVTSFADC